MGITLREMEERWIDLGGIRLWLRLWGSPHARPILCWHGLGLRASLLYNELGPLLAERDWRVIAVDAPGFGSSPALSYDTYRPSMLASLVPRLLDALTFDSCVFLGFSWGASIGCYVGANHQERVEALVFLDAGYSDPPNADPDLTLDEFLQRARAEAAEYAEQIRDWRTAVTVFQGQAARWTPAVEAQWRAALHEEGDALVPVMDVAVIGAAEWGLAREPPSSAWGRLAEGGRPLLLLTATNADLEDVQRWTCAVPHAVVKPIPSPTHDVVVNAPAEVADAVAEWLAQLRP